LIKISPRLSQKPVWVRIALFLGLLLALWLPVAIPLYLLVADQNLLSIITMATLYLIFVWLLRQWGKQVYGQRQIICDYGLGITQKNGLWLLLGLGIGLGAIAGLFLGQSQLGWLSWQTPQLPLGQLVLEGLLLGIAVGLAEELLFRGWLWDELQRDYPGSISLLLNALIFAVLHFLKPLEVMLASLPQLPGLFLLGLALVWAKRAAGGDLGLAIGLHGGLVWGYYIVNVGQLATYSGRVSPLITGVGGNPLAGVAGLLCLGFLASLMYVYQARSPKVF